VHSLFSIPNSITFASPFEAWIAPKANLKQKRKTGRLFARVSVGVSLKVPEEAQQIPPFLNTHPYILVKLKILLYNEFS
jgi:hypothetical protein